MSPKVSTLDNSESVFLSPTHRLPLIIIFIGLVLLPIPINSWLSIVITTFGLFLLLQSFILRLEFASDALVVWQLGRELRRFPFENWLAWRLFFPGLPGILYFREKASPHLLPILFDPTSLENQLLLKVGSLKFPKDPSTTNS